MGYKPNKNIDNNDNIILFVASITPHKLAKYEIQRTVTDGDDVEVRLHEYLHQNRLVQHEKKHDLIDLCDAKESVSFEKWCSSAGFYSRLCSTGVHDDRTIWLLNDQISVCVCFFFLFLSRFFWLAVLFERALICSNLYLNHVISVTF